MRKFQCLLYVLKWSYICYCIICMAVPLILLDLESIDLTVTLTIFVVTFIRIAFVTN